MLVESFVGVHLDYPGHNLPQHLYQYIGHIRIDGRDDSAVDSQNIGDTANTLSLGTVVSVVHFAVEMVAVLLLREGRVPLHWPGTGKDYNRGDNVEVPLAFHTVSFLQVLLLQWQAEEGVCSLNTVDGSRPVYT